MFKSRLLRVVTMFALAIATLMATAVAASAQPGIRSVTFSGPAGPGVGSPTITVTGAAFGLAPPGASDDVTSCGTYTANGDVYKNRFYFNANAKFEAGYSNPSGANCIGIIIQSWTAHKIVFTFGSAYGTFAHWYLNNGANYAISVKSALWGGRVTGLT